MRFVSESLSRTPLLLDEAKLKTSRPRAIARGRGSKRSAGNAALRAGAGQFRSKSKGNDQFAAGSSGRGGSLQVGGGYGQDAYYSRVVGQGGGNYSRDLTGLVQKSKGSLQRLISLKPPPPHFYGR